MKLTLHSVFLVLILIAEAHQATARESRFFRVAGPAASAIISFQTDGTLIWSNAQPGLTYKIQTSFALIEGTNWVDYVQIPTTNSLNTNQVVVFNPPAGMVFVPAGSFTMGDTVDGDSDALPMNIYVSAFFMDQNLVTYSQWHSVRSWALTNGYKFDGSGLAKGTNHPVELIDWFDLIKWSNARSQLAGLVPVYYTDPGQTQLYTNGNTYPVYPNWAANGYRLPTEAEWEKAARGGLSGHRFPWGDTINESQADYVSYWQGAAPYYSYDESTTTGPNPMFGVGAWPYTSPVGYFGANGYGLNDMAGNVSERCWDWYGTPYGQPNTSDPNGPASGSLRVSRGGAWDLQANYARCASRCTLNASPIEASYDTGFRCVRKF